MKAQVKMFETVAVLVVFFFLVGFGLSFYFVMAKSADAQASERIFEAKGMQTAQKISTIPELDCARLGVSEENCFDKIKIESFSEILKDELVEQEFFTIFGYSEINVRLIFPYEETIPLYNKGLSDKGYKFIQYPIKIYDPIFKSYGFGVLEIKFYEL